MAGILGTSARGLVVEELRVVQELAHTHTQKDLELDVQLVNLRKQDLVIQIVVTVSYYLENNMKS